MKVIGQLNPDGIGWKTRVKFVISQWSVSIRLLLVKSSLSAWTWVRLSVCLRRGKVVCHCKAPVVVDIC